MRMVSSSSSWVQAMPMVMGARPAALTFSMSAIQASMVVAGLVGSSPAALSADTEAHTTLARWMLEGTE